MSRYFFGPGAKKGKLFSSKKNPNKTYGKIRAFLPDPALDFGKTQKVPNKTYGVLGPFFRNLVFDQPKNFFKFAKKNK